MEEKSPAAEGSIPPPARFFFTCVDFDVANLDNRGAWAAFHLGYEPMIRTFADAETARIWNGERSRKLPPDIQNAARRKLRQLNRTTHLHQLRIPRGNRLEELKGRRKGTYSIRINEQWRITFRWSNGDADDVRVEDYHPG